MKKVTQVIKNMIQKLTHLIKKLPEMIKKLKVKKFSTFDFAIFMIVLFSFGTLIGAYYSLAIRSNLYWLTLVIVAFAVPASYIPYITATRIKKCCVQDPDSKEDSDSDAATEESSCCEAAAKEPNTAKVGKMSCFQKIVDIIKDFNICEFAMFKLYLLTIGVLFGILLEPILITIILLMWIIFVGSCSYLSFVIYKKMKEEQ